MSLPESLARRLSIPVIGAPMFIISSPELVIEQCRAGIVGSFPALNARGEGALRDWLERIQGALEDGGDEGSPEVAPFAVNQIVHPSNARLNEDVDVCVEHEVPIIITSLSKPTQIVDRVHGYGGLVFHDVINVTQAQKALEAGVVDGLILVCAGAGGHTGTLNPFAFVDEVRRFF